MDSIIIPQFAWAALLQNIQEAIETARDFDIRTPADLYKVFTMCHLYSWAIILYKMRNI